MFFLQKKLILFLARKKITLFRIQNWFKNKVVKAFFKRTNNYIFTKPNYTNKPKIILF